MEMIHANVIHCLTVSCISNESGNLRNSYDLKIGKTQSEQVVLSVVQQSTVSAGGIDIAMHTIPPVAKKGGVY